MKKAIPIAAVVAVVAVGLVVWLRMGSSRPGTDESADGASVSAVTTAAADEAAGGESPSAASGAETAGDSEDIPPKTAEEVREEAEEAAVESFDALTDKWMEPTEKGVAMSDVSDFLAQFKRVPSDRREECLQRALNLVPDENVMLLVGILMDKSQPKDLLELVFNDILNRDEAVKNPILAEIVRDRSHPCWADAAWVLDATDGEGE